MEIIKLNIIPNGITPICHASQFDIKRKIGIALFDNMDPYNLSGEETVSLSVRKPDKTIITKTLEFEAGNYLEFETTEQMCAIAGENKCEIKISYDDMTIGSLNFIMQVERDPLFKGIQSESEIENLQEQVNTAVAAAVSGQYDSENVIFDSEPTLNNGIPYTVTSGGIKRALNLKADLTALSNLITLETKSTERITYTANQWVTMIIDITKEGYTPIAIVGISQIASHTANDVRLVDFHINGNNAQVRFVNRNTEQSIVTSVTVLYKKT